MQKKAAIIQFSPAYGPAEVNLPSLSRLIREAANAKASLIILPEMCLNGYLYPSREQIEPLAEEANGSSFRFLSQLCHTLNVHLVYGFAEKASTKLYNSQNLIDSDGHLAATYRKRHLFEADQPWASVGINPYVSVKTTLGKLGLGICMDLNFNDLPEFHQQQKTDLLCLSMHWLDEGLDVHSYWNWRLSGFQGLALISNSFGTIGDIKFCGRSSFLQRGLIIKSAPKSSETIIYHDFL